MSLNIKNPRTVALVRELAERTGQTQTGAIEQAILASLRRLDEGSLTFEQELRVSRVDAVLEEIHGSLAPHDRAALLGAQEDLYDAEGLPQ